MFTGRLITEDIGDGKYILIESFKYNDIVIPRGFITDFASTPKWIHWLFEPQSKYYSKASIVHDYLYFSKKLTRLEADKEFLNAMKDEQTELNPRTAWLTRYAFYWIVRAIGDLRWH